MSGNFILTTFSKIGPDLCSYPIISCNKFKEKAADSEVKIGSHRKNEKLVSGIPFVGR